MRSIFLVLLFSIFSNNIHSQVDSLKTIRLDVTILVNDLKKVKEDLDMLFYVHKIVPDLFNESNNRFNSQFVLTANLYYKFVESIENWGAIDSKKIESVNYTEKLNDVNREIQKIEEEIKDYQLLLSEVDIKSENHVKYWEKLEKAKDNLRKQYKFQKDYLASNKKFKVSLNVREENFLTNNEPDFSFVNMPGIQFSFFIPTNSDQGLYPESMNGYSIKYLLNRRKTYLELGLFKSNQDSSFNRFDELYKFGIGQDFYSTHLGRGTRKFLNLYSGLKVGALIFTGNEENLVSWYATPAIGLELYKNRNILLDSKVGYFLPFKENRNIRGFLLETSFNIVF